MRTDSPAMLESLEAISGFYRKGNTLEARKSLRQDLDKENYSLSLKFLENFEKLKIKLESVENYVSSLEAGCESIADRLSAADDHMHQYMKEAKTLEDKRCVLKGQCSQVDSFLKRFQLGEDEVGALTLTPGKTPSTEFFTALKKLGTTREECAGLMGGKHQSAGFELLEILAQHQERAYEQLYEWVQEQCSVLQDENPEADATLQVAMKALRERPVYYQHCQESIGTMRRKLLGQRFQAALTGQGGGVQRPIDLQAHDPLRYVGDILAWVHQASALERELIGALFASSKSSEANKADGTEKDSSLFPELPEDPALSAERVLDVVMSGIEQQLKSRLGQVVESQTQCVECYRLLSLLNFYADTMSRVLSPGTSLGRTLQLVIQEGENLFFDLLKQMGEKLVSSPPSYPTDLSTLRETVDTVKCLQEMLQINTSSMSDPLEDHLSESETDAILTALIEPLLQMCRLSAEGLAPSDTAAFMLNNTFTIQSALLSFEGTRPWAEKLSVEVDTWLDSLVASEYEKMLESCGLKRVLHVMEICDNKGPASEQPGLDETSLASAMNQFYSSLFTLVMPDFEKVQEPKIKSQARQKTALALSDAHSKIYTMVTNEHNKYQNKSFLQHTPQQVKVLLDCD